MSNSAISGKYFLESLEANIVVIFKKVPSLIQYHCPSTARQQAATNNPIGSFCRVIRDSLDPAHPLLMWAFLKLFNGNCCENCGLVASL